METSYSEFPEEDLFKTSNYKFEELGAPPSLSIQDAKATRDLISSLQNQISNLRSSCKFEPVTSPSEPSVLETSPKEPSPKSERKQVQFHTSPPKQFKQSPKKPQKDFDFPSYSRGIDPPPDLDIGFMQRKPEAKPTCIPPEKLIYEQKYEKYLKEKYQSKASQKGVPRMITWEDPEIIKHLKQLFLRWCGPSSLRLSREVLLQELAKNPEVAELFGFEPGVNDAQVKEVFDNTGSEATLSLDEFLMLFQVSKNNTVKPLKKFIEEDQKPETKDCPKKESLSVPEHLQQKLIKIFHRVEIKTGGENNAELLGATLKNEESLFKSFSEVIQEILENSSEVEVIAQDIIDDIVNKNSEALTVSEFLKYFEFLNKFHKIQDEKLFEIKLNANQVATLNEVLENIPEETPGFLNTQELVRSLSEDAEVQAIWNESARKPLGIGDVPEETVGEVIERITAEAPSNLTQEEFFFFFTVKGRPDPVKSQKLSKTQPKQETPQEVPLGTRYNITVPEPFNFERREGRKGTSIRERKLKEMLEEKEQQVKEVTTCTYKAKPVPPEVKIPLFEQIMREQEERRCQVKKESVALTKAMEKPFSFYFRDLLKSQKQPQPLNESQPVFHANPVPWTTKLPLYHKMVSEREASRKERIEKAKKELLKQSKMPPRMEMHQNTKEEPKPRAQSAKRFKAKEVPDFKALQAQFQASLDSKKGSFVPTQPQPFKFNDNIKSHKYLKFLDKTEDAQVKWGILSKPRTKSLGKPKIVPSMTQKAKEMIEYKRKTLQAQKEKQLKLQEEENQRLKKQEKMRKVVQNSSAVKSHKAELKQKQKEINQARKDNIKQAEAEYKAFKRDMKARLAERPLLIEQVVMQHIAKQLNQMGQQFYDEQHILGNLSELPEQDSLGESESFY